LMTGSGLSTAGLVLVVVMLAIVPLVTVVIFKTRFKRVPLDKAMVVYGHYMPGSCRGYMVIVGGAKFITPISEEYAVLDLSPRTAELELRSATVRLNDGRGRASGKIRYSYRVRAEEAVLDTAAEHLTGLDPAEVSRMVEGYVEAAFKAFIASCPFPTSPDERRSFTDRFLVFNKSDLWNVGVGLDSMDIDGLRLVGGG